MSKVSTVSIPRLGVNIDHVASIRNARDCPYPDPLKAAHMAVQGGADGITAHLREDRRHIREDDIARLISELTVPLNLEMAPTAEMLSIALRHGPHACCLVPERREERTTESGLDVAGVQDCLSDIVASLHDGGIKVSLFIEPILETIDSSLQIGVDIIELHTGKYCEYALNDDVSGMRREFLQLKKAAQFARSEGLEVHAGHGLTYSTVVSFARLPEIIEFNIGHFLVGEAIFEGISAAVSRMRKTIDDARKNIL